MTFLPNFQGFGSTANRFGNVPSLQPLTAETALSSANAVPPPLGVDLGFDFGTGEFLLSAGGDLVLVSEEIAFEQWLTNALVTTRGQDIIYDFTFGSQIADIIGAGFVIDALITEAVKYISEAVLIHDRIASVENFLYYLDMDSIVFYFDVVTDEALRFQFGGLQIG